MTAVKTMSRDELRAVIFDALTQVAPETDPGTLAPDEDMRSALDIDSFDFLNVLIAINEQTGVEIPEADYGQVNTLAGLIAYLEARG